MTARYKTPIEKFTRGGDTFRQKAAMLLQSMGWVFTVSIISSILIGLVSVRLMLSSDEWIVWWQFQVARIETVTGLGGVRWFSIDGKRPWEILEIAGPYYRHHFWPTNLTAICISVGVFFTTALSIIRFYFYYGVTQSEEDFIRGAQLVTKEELIDQVQKSKDGVGRYHLAGVPLPCGKEMRNILVTGSMGTGKSQALLALAEEVCAAGKKMIIYDKVGEFTEAFYRPGKDVILNPFDARYPGWNIFKEIKHTYEFEQMAHSLIPDPEGSSNSNSAYFAAGARTVFYSVLQKLWAEGRRTTNALADVLLNYSPAKIAAYLDGTPASAYISPKAAEQAGGVLSTLVGAIQVLKHIPSGDFSIKEWVKRDDDSRIFISSNESIHAIVRPLIAMYLDVAIRSVMAGERVQEDKIWIFADEFSSLGPMPIFKDSLTECRKYGGVHVLGCQNVAQIRTAFGPDVAQTLRSNLQTYLILRVSDEDTQEAYSKLLGGQENDEQSEGLSFGAGTAKDGASVNTARKERRIVIPSQIKLLDDMEGYLQLSGAFDVAKVSYVGRSFAKVAEGFTLRSELILDQSMPAARPTATANDMVDGVPPWLDAEFAELDGDVDKQEAVVKKNNDSGSVAGRITF